MHRLAELSHVSSCVFSKKNSRVLSDYAKCLRSSWQKVTPQFLCVCGSLHAKGGAPHRRAKCCMNVAAHPWHRKQSYIILTCVYLCRGNPVDVQGAASARSGQTKQCLNERRVHLANEQTSNGKLPLWAYSQTPPRRPVWNGWTGAVQCTRTSTRREED